MDQSDLKFDSKTSGRLRVAMLASREALREATCLLSNAHVAAATSQGSGPTAAETRAFSQATAAEQRATAEYLEYLSRMSDLALRRSRRDPS